LCEDAIFSSYRNNIDRDQNYLLGGVIEMDEAYWGASKHKKKRGRGTERTKIAVAGSKNEKDCPLFPRLPIIPDVTAATLQPGLRERNCTKMAYPAWRQNTRNTQRRFTSWTPVASPVKL
jgi:hypothetical protein